MERRILIGALIAAVGQLVGSRVGGRSPMDYDSAMIRAALPLIALSLPAAPLLAQARRADSLTAPERAVVRWTEDHRAEAESLLERLVNQNSGTLNLAGVRAVGDILRREFDQLGFQTRWVDGTPFGRAGHLIAEHPGSGPRLLLIGHLDTVFEPDHPFQKFERIDSVTARGPGIIDMKGGDVIIVQALKALAAAGLLDRLAVTVVMTGDEEQPGEPRALARESLIAAARGAAAAIGFEDGSGDPTKAVVTRRGFTGWTLTVTGKAAHSSQIFQPEVGAGAVFEAARVLDQFRRRLAGERLLTFNPGLALGGTAAELDSGGVRGTAAGKTNVVAERMVVKGELRTISAEQLARTKKAMEEIVAASLPRTHATIEFADGYPPLAPSPGNDRLLGVIDRVSRDLGFHPVAGTDPLRAGAADVSFTAGIVPMAIDGIGLAGRDDHSAGETADLGLLPYLIARAAIFLHRVGGGPKA
jgi:glutamate carboxypeptidase